MDAYVDLLLHLRYKDARHYEVESQIAGTLAVSNVEPLPGVVSFDFEALAAEPDPQAYGELLTRSLFADPKVLTAFTTATTAAAVADTALRLRISIDPEVPELHALWWEVLQDPRSNDGDAMLA